MAITSRGHRLAGAGRAGEQGLQPLASARPRARSPTRSARGRGGAGRRRWSAGRDAGVGQNQVLPAVQPDPAAPRARQDASSKPAARPRRGRGRTVCAPRARPRAGDSAASRSGRRELELRRDVAHVLGAADLPPRSRGARAGPASALRARSSCASPSASAAAREGGDHHDARARRRSSARSSRRPACRQSGRGRRSTSRRPLERADQARLGLLKIAVAEVADVGEQERLLDGARHERGGRRAACGAALGPPIRRCRSSSPAPTPRRS